MRIISGFDFPEARDTSYFKSYFFSGDNVYRVCILYSVIIMIRTLIAADLFGLHFITNAYKRLEQP